MPVMICASTDDEHAPFPHRLVIPMETRRQRSRVTGEMITSVTLSGSVFVICANCDHWISRTVKRCRCRHLCHPGMYS